MALCVLLSFYMISDVEACPQGSGQALVRPRKCPQYVLRVSGGNIAWSLGQELRENQCEQIKRALNDR